MTSSGWRIRRLHVYFALYRHFPSACFFFGQFHFRSRYPHSFDERHREETWNSAAGKTNWLRNIYFFYIKYPYFAPVYRKRKYDDIWLYRYVVPPWWIRTVYFWWKWMPSRQAAQSRSNQTGRQTAEQNNPFKFQNKMPCTDSGSYFTSLHRIRGRSSWIFGGGEI